MEHILQDPRVRPDTYYIEALGPLGPALVKLIRAWLAYINRAKGAEVLIQRVKDAFGAQQCNKVDLEALGAKR